MAKSRIQDDPKYQSIMGEAESIEAPCEPTQFRVLTPAGSRRDDVGADTMGP